MQLRAFVSRSQHRLSPTRVAVAGLGSALAVGLLGLIGQSTGHALLAATLGASCVLVFALPEAPVSQPFTLVAGHVLSSSIGWAAASTLPHTWWATAIASGVAISAMALARIVHPPAGADPIVLMTSGTGPAHLLAPVLLGSVLVVALGVLVHRANRTTYPVLHPHVSNAAQGETGGRSRREPQPAG